MKLLVKVLFICTIIFNLVGCSSGVFKIYRSDLKQGNFVEQKTLDKLRVGLSKQQVKDVMGTSTFISCFHQDQWTYSYRFVPGSRKKPVVYKKLILHFKNGKLKYYEGDWQIPNLPKLK